MSILPSSFHWLRGVWRRPVGRLILPGLTALCGWAGAAADVPVPLPDDWYPESMAVGPDGSFWVGSWRQGAIVQVRPGAGAQPASTRVVVPPAAGGMANVQGVLVDSKRRTLWACSGDMGYSVVPTTPSVLKRYDLASGAFVASYVLPDAGYCNDLAQSADGTVYVTDSRHPRVLSLVPGARALEIWKEDPALGAGQSPYSGLNGIALDGERAVYVSLVVASDHVLRIERTPDAKAGAVTPIVAPRELKNVDALRIWKPGHMVLFESNAMGKKPFGGQITLARAEGDHLILQTLVSGLNDPSSGVVWGHRVYYIESKYRLLTQREPSEGPVPTGVPFDIRSRALPPD